MLPHGTITAVPEVGVYCTVLQGACSVNVARSLAAHLAACSANLLRRPVVRFRKVGPRKKQHLNDKQESSCIFLSNILSGNFCLVSHSRLLCTVQYTV